MNQTALDFTTARAEGEAAAGRCLDAAESRGFDTDGAKRYVLAHLVRFGPSSGEDLVTHAKLHGYRGKDDRCFGGVFLSLQRAGKIRCIRSDLPRARGHGTSGGRLWGLVDTAGN